MAPLRATYRLQLGPELDFAAAGELVPYLSGLGISHLYLSPVYEARAGSPHGYDVIDPARLSAALGGEDGFRALAATVLDAGMGIVLDVVPNHMAVDDANRYWADERLRPRFFDIDRETGRHRRFFDIDHLAGVRQEDPEVFAATHELVLGLVAEGLVDGLRIDHPDGLADPAGYLERLRAAGVRHVWVEKILDPGERLRDWPVEGTVGYEFANDAVALFAEPAAAAPLTELWEELSGDARPFAGWAEDAKLEQARTTFAADIDWLRRLRPGVERLEEALSALPVYRTYIKGEPSAEDRAVLAEAGLEDWLAGASPEFVTRFQQLTPPIMAKGVEDTAFYRYARLLALNDVGGDPGRFSIGAEAFHAGNAERARRFPRHMLSSQTHDSKRSGDLRARLTALTWMAADWVAQARRWRELCAPLRTGGAPDAVEEHTIHQTLVGAWPIDPERLCGFMRKAMREAKVHSSWVAPDEQHERRVLDYCRALYSDAAFREAFEPFAARVAAAGELIALRQTALKLTVPGVPDIYQGDELVTLSLVDPDNRRAVDWQRARELTEQLAGGAVADGPDARKLALVRDLLALRARRPDAFAGSYEPLAAGPDAVAFVRGGEVAVAVPVRGDANVPGVPGDWVPAGSFPAGITVLERAGSG